MLRHWGGRKERNRVPALKESMAKGRSHWKMLQDGGEGSMGQKWGLEGAFTHRDQWECRCACT